MRNFYNKIKGSVPFLSAISVVLLLSISLYIVELYYPGGFYSNESNQQPLVISDEGRTLIQNAVVRSSDIIGIQVMGVDFYRNVRTEIFTTISDPALAAIIEEFKNNKILEIPVFTENKAANDEVLRLINKGYQCTAFKDTVMYRYVPDAGKVINHVCSIGIPYDTQGFSGVLEIYISTETISSSKYAEIFLFAREVSHLITEDNIESGNIRQQ